MNGRGEPPRRSQMAGAKQCAYTGAGGAVDGHVAAEAAFADGEVRVRKRAQEGRGKSGPAQMGARGKWA